MTRRVLRTATLAACVPMLACAVGYAPMSGSTISRAPDPAALYGARANRTAFEEPNAAAGAPAPVAGPAPRADGPEGPQHDADQRRRTGVFWGGIATTALGGAMLTAFGIGGRVTQAQLKNGYDDGDLSYAREDTLRDRGKVFNALAGAGAGIAVVGAAMAVIAYGLDYSRCGTLAKRRKDCRSGK